MKKQLNGVTTSNPSLIRKEIENFFTDIYASKVDGF